MAPSWSTSSIFGNRSPTWSDALAVMALIRRSPQLRRRGPRAVRVGARLEDQRNSRFRSSPQRRPARATARLPSPLQRCPVVRVCGTVHERSSLPWPAVVFDHDALPERDVVFDAAGGDRRLRVSTRQRLGSRGHQRGSYGTKCFLPLAHRPRGTRLQNPERTDSDREVVVPLELDPSASTSSDSSARRRSRAMWYSGVKNPLCWYVATRSSRTRPSSLRRSLRR